MARLKNLRIGQEKDKPPKEERKVSTDTTGEKSMIIAVDFDGTIVQEDRVNFPTPGPLLPHAVRVINALYDAGHTIIIWTCREDKPKELAKALLAEVGIRYHHINENHPESVKNYYDSRKVYADIYIGDRIFGGLLGGWIEVERRLLKPDKVLSTDDLIQGIRDIVENELAPLMKRKGLGYSGYSKDHLANIREGGLPGILTRLSDKFNRVRSYQAIGNVVDEDWDEVLNDIINYAFFIKLILRGK